MIAPHRGGRIRPMMGVTVVAAAVLAVLPTGCSDEPTEIVWPEDPPAPTNEAQSPTAPDAGEAEATEDILDVVQGFREAEIAIYSDPQPPHISRYELSRYLADPLLTETLVTLNDMQQAGIVFEGQQVTAATVAELRLNETPSTAIVRDCVDASNWRSIFRESGDPVPGEDQPDRYVARLQVTLYEDGWLVSDIDVEGGAQC